jgi:glyoxylase-like metal-dependent hydrolase (beta-lactamase superfamily II)
MPIQRKEIFSVFAGLALVLTLISFSYAQDSAEVQVTTEKIAENIYVFQDSGGMGNVTALTGDDGVLMIDTKVEASADILITEIAKICPKPVRFVVITHWHFDHVGGNETVAKTGAAVIAHENVRKQMGIDHNMELLETEVPASPETEKPVMTYEKSLTFHMNDETVEVFHLGPGHTDGDTVIYFRSANVIHMGDLYFEGLYPYIGIYSGGSIDGMIKVINEILPMIDGDTKVVPGHGPVTDKARLQEFVSMLTTIRYTVSRLMREGKSLEEVVAAKPTRAFDEKWGDGFLPPDQFASLVYMDLSPEMP